jgi:hypothetical protein
MRLERSDLKRIIWIVGLSAIVAAAIVLARRCTVADNYERVGSGAPTERAEPQARAS